MTATKQRQRISVTMALESLRDQVDETEARRQDYLRAVAKRNNMIRDAREAEVASRTIERIANLSRDRIARIASAPHEPLGDY